MAESSQSEVSRKQMDDVPVNRGGNVVFATVEEERDFLQREIDRLQEDLALTSKEKHQSAELGLQLLDQRDELQRRLEDAEAAFDSTKNELEVLRHAMEKLQTSQKMSATSGIEQEESLLMESATKEASFTSTLNDLERELKQVRHELDRVRGEKERLIIEQQDINKQLELVEWEKKNSKTELKEIKSRETRLINDISELEDENISLQKQVSILKSSQIEFESSKHEVRRLQEELEVRKLQVEEYETLKNIAEKQMKEALDALESEREQKYEMKKKLEEKINNDSMLNISNFGLRFPGLTGFGSKHIHSSLPPTSRTYSSTCVSMSVLVNQNPRSQFIYDGSRYLSAKSIASKKRYSDYIPDEQLALSATSDPRIMSSLKVQDAQMLSTEILNLIRDKYTSIVSKTNPVNHRKSNKFRHLERRFSPRVRRRKAITGEPKRWRLDGSLFSTKKLFRNNHSNGAHSHSLSPLQRVRLESSVKKQKQFIDDELDKQSKGPSLVTSVQFTNSIRNRLSNLSRIVPDRKRKKSLLASAGALRHLDIDGTSSLRQKSNSQSGGKTNHSNLISGRNKCVSCLKVTLKVIATCCLSIFGP